MSPEAFHLQAQSSSSPVAILEIGSGFNQLADAVLQEMQTARQPLQYTLSCHSQMMLGRAKKEFKASPSMSFQTLDCAQDVIAQVKLQNCP